MSSSLLPGSNTGPYLVALNCGALRNLARYTLKMNREKTIELLRQHKPLLDSRFGVIELALFGSTARDSAQPGSDVDILVGFVGFAGKATSAQYFGVQFYLEDLFGCTVDLVTQKALRKELRPFVEHEAIYV